MNNKKLNNEKLILKQKEIKEMQEKNKQISKDENAKNSFLSGYLKRKKEQSKNNITICL